MVPPVIHKPTSAEGRSASTRHFGVLGTLPRGVGINECWGTMNSSHAQNVGFLSGYDLKILAKRHCVPSDETNWFVDFDGGQRRKLGPAEMSRGGMNGTPDPKGAT